MAGVPPVLRLEGLERSYGATRGVGPVTLSLEEGIHGLVGPNGSGKTTLLKTLLGFLHPTAGRAEVLGLDVVREIRQVRSRVGYMAENDVFVPGLNAAGGAVAALEAFQAEDGRHAGHLRGDYSSTPGRPCECQGPAAYSASAWMLAL